jgi:hypothetical protein
MKQSMQENVAAVANFGITLLAIGILSYVLPWIGIQFQLVTLLRLVFPHAGLVIAGLGVLMLLAARKGAARLEEASRNQPTQEK